MYNTSIRPATNHGIETDTERKKKSKNILIKCEHKWCLSFHLVLGKPPFWSLKVQHFVNAIPDANGKHKLIPRSAVH